MDATQGDAATVSAEEAQRTVIRRWSWTVAVGLPLIASIIGIALTSTGTVEQWNSLGDDTYDVVMFAVWPAGLVLLSVGLLGLIATALTAAVLTTKRSS
ncbi:hypothetical protein [Microbacterium paraoxydans]|uniref:hypothetical protein n=1 Tax=Microbacterium paraoxydans TaxID=199592 RepID=UPI001CFA65B0|nr:hypothetical protein [Microbacterium paraoxydans]